MAVSRSHCSRRSNGVVALCLAPPVLAALFVGFQHMPAFDGAKPSGAHRHTSSGIKLVVPAAIDPISVAQVEVSSFLPVHGPMHYGQYLWNERGVPPGRSWILVDLDSQIISVFRGGREIGTAVILYGGDSTPTPLGRFRVLARLRNHRSSLYDAPMPFTIRLTDDGVSIHGSSVVRGAATHGCIGIPTAFAARLFEAIRQGDEVTIVSSRGAEGVRQSA